MERKIKKIYNIILFSDLNRPFTVVAHFENTITTKILPDSKIKFPNTPK